LVTGTVLSGLTSGLTEDLPEDLPVSWTFSIVSSTFFLPLFVFVAGVFTTGGGRELRRRRRRHNQGPASPRRRGIRGGITAGAAVGRTAHLGRVGRDHRLLRARRGFRPGPGLTTCAGPPPSRLRPTAPPTGRLTAIARVAMKITAPPRPRARRR
jgi:hypothetical protein